MRKRLAKMLLSCSVLTHSHRFLSLTKKKGGGDTLSPRQSFLDVPLGTPLVCNGWGLSDHCCLLFLLAQSLPEIPIALCASYPLPILIAYR